MARFDHQWIESCFKDYANKNLGNVTQILNEYLDKEVGDHYGKDSVKGKFHSTPQEVFV